MIPNDTNIDYKQQLILLYTSSIPNLVAKILLQLSLAYGHPLHDSSKALSSLSTAVDQTGNGAFC